MGGSDALTDNVAFDVLIDDVSPSSTGLLLVRLLRFGSGAIISLLCLFSVSISRVRFDEVVLSLDRALLVFLLLPLLPSESIPQVCLCVDATVSTDFGGAFDDVVVHPLNIVIALTSSPPDCSKHSRNRRTLDRELNLKFSFGE